MMVRQRRPLDQTRIETPAATGPPGDSPAGRVPAGESAPPGWGGLGGDLDIVARTARGTVYRSRSRQRHTHTHSLLTLAGIAGVVALVAAAVALVALSWLASQLGL